MQIIDYGNDIDTTYS